MLIINKIFFLLLILVKGFLNKCQDQSCFSIDFNKRSNGHTTHLSSGELRSLIYTVMLSIAMSVTSEQQENGKQFKE